MNNIDPTDPDWPTVPHLDPEDDPATLKRMDRELSKGKYSFDLQDNNASDPEQAGWDELDETIERSRNA